jgi:hypothetical protein
MTRSRTPAATPAASTPAKPARQARSASRLNTVVGSLALGLAAGVATAQTPPALPTTPTTATIPMVIPHTEFVYEAIVDLEPTLALGPSPYGERRMVPIVGGTFEGPGLRGKVMAGGADRQLVRRDGATALDAIYELQTHDGVVISIRNRVLSRPLKAPATGRYARSTIDIVAPDGPYGWLNDHVYVGTLDSLRPARNAVVIRVFRVL